MPMSEDLEGKIKFVEGVLKDKRERRSREMEKVETVRRASADDAAAKKAAPPLFERVRILEKEIAKDERRLDELIKKRDSRRSAKS
jgi:endonuclease III